MRTLTSRAVPAAALLLTACPEPPWDAWNPEAVLPTDDALLVPLPVAGEVARLAPDGSAERIDLDPWRVRAVEVTPDGTRSFARVVAQVCESDPGAPIDRGCTDGDAVVLGRIVDLDDPARFWDAGPWFGPLAFSPDGRWAVAAIDEQASVFGGGLVSLDSVLVVDLVDGGRFEVPVGFRASRVAFTGPSDAVSGLVVLSQSEVATIALDVDVPVVGTTFPLTLDPGAQVRPVDVVITPDDRYALLTVADSPDLYVLDLVDPSINLVTLPGLPSRLVADPTRDRTLVLFRSRPELAVLDHDRFELTSIPLGATLSEASLGDDEAILWSPEVTLAARLDLAAGLVDPIALNFPPSRLEVAPDRSFAVTFAWTAGARLEVLDLRPGEDGRIPDESRPFGLDGSAQDLLFREAGDGGTELLLLQEGSPRLFRLAWPSLETSSLRLDGQPVALGAVGDRPYVAFSDPWGRVGWVDGDALVAESYGFAGFGLGDWARYLREDQLP